MDRESRDLLIELRTKVENIATDVKELKDNTASRLATVEQGKLDRVEAIRLQNEMLGMITDHDKRILTGEKSITQIQTFGTAALIGLGLLEFVLNYFK